MKKIAFIILITTLSVACQREVNTADLPGDKKKFDPIVALPKVTKYINKEPVLNLELFNIGTLYLLDIRAIYIKPDGTLDLTSDYEPKVFYTYIYQYTEKEKEEEPEKKHPIGVERVEKIKKEAKPPIWVTHGIRIIKPYRRKRVVEGRDSGKSQEEYFYHGGMQKYSIGWPYPPEKGEQYKYKTILENIDKVISAPPPLSFAEIWQKAINAGAPHENTVAIIEYNALYGYTFEIKNTDYKYRFDLAGSLIE